MSCNVFNITYKQVLHSKGSSTYQAPYVFVQHDDSVCVVLRTPVKTVHDYIENSKCPYIIAFWPLTLNTVLLMFEFKVSAELPSCCRLDLFKTQLTLKIK